MPTATLAPTAPPACDYPDYAAAACGAVTNGSMRLRHPVLRHGRGHVDVCQQDQGHPRLLLLATPFSAEYTRRHNNANALCLGGRVVGPGLACQIVDAFLDARI